jgi:hypothetical protein
MNEDLCSYCGCALDKCDCTLEQRGETAEEFEKKIRLAPERIRRIVSKRRAQ